jgi:preprotein translocase SecE subunit
VTDAKKPSKVRKLKKVETVRERSVKAAEPRKPRRVKQATSAAWKPFKWLGRLLAHILRPLRFVLRPFKTRPMRFIGRILAKVLLLNYFRSSWQELRQVSWPDRKQTAQLTLAVFLFAIFFALIITAVDYGLDRLFKDVIIK